MPENWSALQERFAGLHSADWTAVGIAVAAGTSLLFFGWRLYRLGLILCGLVLGAAAAYWVTANVETGLAPVWVLLIGMVAGTVAIWWAEQMAVSLIGGTTGALLAAAGAAQLWKDHPQAASLLAGAAVLGFGLFGWLALMLRKLIVVTATSAWGALMLIMVPLSLAGANADPLNPLAGTDVTAVRSPEDLWGLVPPLGTFHGSLWMILTGIGIMVQFGLTGRGKNEAEQPPAPQPQPLPAKPAPLAVVKPTPPAPHPVGRPIDKR